MDDDQQPDRRPQRDLADWALASSLGPAPILSELPEDACELCGERMSEREQSWAINEGRRGTHQRCYEEDMLPVWDGW